MNKKIFYSVFLFSLFCLAAFSAKSATIRVTTTDTDELPMQASDCAPGSTNSCSLREAIAYANQTFDFDLILLDPSLGEYTFGRLGALGINTDIEIASSSETQKATIRGDSDERFIWGTTTSLASQNGTRKNSIKFKNLLLTNLYAAVGQASPLNFYNLDRLEFENCEVTGNAAQIADTGVLSIRGVTNTLIKDSLFQDNQGYLGGAILAQITELDIENTQFINNTAMLKGGAIYYSGGQINQQQPRGLSIANSLFEGNRSSDGGALYIWAYPSPITIDHTTFRRNKAVRGGVFYAFAGAGAVQRDNPDLSHYLFNNSIFSENEASDTSAVFFLENTHDPYRTSFHRITINNCSIVENKVMEAEGVVYPAYRTAVFYGYSARWSLSYNTVVGNHIYRNPGSSTDNRLFQLASSQSDLRLKGNVFAGNRSKMTDGSDVNELSCFFYMTSTSSQGSNILPTNCNFDLAADDVSEVEDLSGTPLEQLGSIITQDENKILLPIFGSPLINRAESESCVSLADEFSDQTTNISFDVLGNQRPLDRYCDIGAVERVCDFELFLDEDGDGYGDASTRVLVCERPEGQYVTAGSDCDDSDAGFYFYAGESCEPEGSSIVEPTSTPSSNTETSATTSTEPLPEPENEDSLDVPNVGESESSEDSEIGTESATSSTPVTTGSSSSSSSSGATSSGGCSLNIKN